MLSRLVASADPLTGRFAALRERTAMAVSFSWLQLLAILRAQIPLDRFDGAEFGDFLWRALFEMSLPPKELELCRTARYATLWAPWRSMHATALLPWPQRYPRVDTSGYDVPFGGGTPGPRFLIPVLPFLALGVAAAYRAWPWSTLALAVPSAVLMLGVTATDVIAAIQTQNNVNPAGQIGGEPAPQAPTPAA